MALRHRFSLRFCCVSVTDFLPPSRSPPSPGVWGLGRSGLRTLPAGSPIHVAETGLSSYGPVVHLPLLSTLPCGNAVTSGFGQEASARRGLAPLGLCALGGALGLGLAKNVDLRHEWPASAGHCAVGAIREMCSETLRKSDSGLWNDRTSHQSDVTRAHLE